MTTNKTRHARSYNTVPVSGSFAMLQYALYKPPVCLLVPTFKLLSRINTDNNWKIPDLVAQPGRISLNFDFRPIWGSPHVADTLKDLQSWDVKSGAAGMLPCKEVSAHFAYYAGMWVQLTDTQVAVIKGQAQAQVEMPYGTPKEEPKDEIDEDSQAAFSEQIRRMEEGGTGPAWLSKLNRTKR